MATQIFTYTIKHPPGIAVSLFTINYKGHDRRALDTNLELVAGEYTIKGEISLTSSRSSIKVHIEASGAAHLKLTYNLKFKDKAVFKQDVELTTSSKGVINDTSKETSLP